MAYSLKADSTDREPPLVGKGIANPVWVEGAAWLPHQIPKAINLYFLD
jgi:hypothetical protein